MLSQNKLINLIVLTHEPVPIGMAATNRIFSYSKGLVEIGHKVFVCSSKPGFNNSFNKTIGKFDGVVLTRPNRIGKIDSHFFSVNI